MYNLAKFINFTIKDALHIFFTLSIINTLLFYMHKDFFVLMSLQVLLMIFSICTIRVGNVFVYNKISHTLSMSIFYQQDYLNMDYKKEKDKISSLFTKEAIDGILENKPKLMLATTHHFVVKNIFESEQIQSLYYINAIPCGICYPILDVLLLSGGDNSNIHKRHKYFIIARRKQVARA